MRESFVCKEDAPATSRNPLSVSRPRLRPPVQAAGKAQPRINNSQRLASFNVQYAAHAQMHRVTVALLMYLPKRGQRGCSRPTPANPTVP
jgi:hypothetical protein